MEVPAEAADFNSIYEEALMNLKTRKPAVPKGLAGVVSAAEKEQAAKDYYASVRTNVRVIMISLHLPVLIGLMTPGVVTLGIDKRTSAWSFTNVHSCFPCRASCWLES